MPLPIRSSSVPRLGDERWKTICDPLQWFLVKWRSWTELDKWRAAHRIGETIFQNALAYLFVNKLARYHRGSDQWGPMEGELPATTRTDLADLSDCPVKNRKKVKWRKKKQAVEEVLEDDFSEDDQAAIGRLVGGRLP